MFRNGESIFCIKCVCLHSETICIIVNKSARHNGNGHNELNLACVYLHSQTLRIILKSLTDSVAFVTVSPFTAANQIVDVPTVRHVGVL